MLPLGPFGPSPRVAAGVSGGPDSLALALLAAGWARSQGGSLSALVVDHGLRPDSGAEAAGVAALLAGQGIAVRVLRLGLAGGAGLQDRARTARHAALLAACAEAGIPWLLLGHQRADQAETLLFRALRGSGATGLAAMASVRVARAALVLRPLLDVPPARLEAVVAAAGLRPVRDPSNADRRFARARLRDALGEPGGAGPATAALAEAAAGFARRRARLGEAMASRLAASAVLRPQGFAELDPAALGQDAVADAVLAALLRAIGGDAFAPPRGAVAALRRRGAGTLAGVWLRPGGRGWLLLREPARPGPAVPAVAGAIWDRRFLLLGPGAPGHELGALGAMEAARLRRWAPRLPAAVLAMMPSIRYNGVLVAVPGLDYPAAGRCAAFETVFAPAGDAVLELNSTDSTVTKHRGHSRPGSASLSYGMLASGRRA